MIGRNKQQLSNKHREQSSTPNANSTDESQASNKSVFAAALTSALLLWLAFPPVGLGFLAWVALWHWCWLIALPGVFSRANYWAIYLAGVVHWLLLLHWMRLPHPATAIGWVLLSLFLATFWPLQIALTRRAVQGTSLCGLQFRVPLALSLALIWMGFEYFRQWFLTGFSMAGLCHSQTDWPGLLQLADIGGATLVSGLLVFVSCSAWQVLMMLREMNWRACAGNFLAGAAALARYIGTVRGNSHCRWSRHSQRH